MQCRQAQQAKPAMHESRKLPQIRQGQSHCLHAAHNAVIPYARIACFAQKTSAMHLTVLTHNPRCSHKAKLGLHLHWPL